MEPQNQNTLKDIILGCLLVLGINILIYLVSFVIISSQQSQNFSDTTKSSTNLVIYLTATFVGYIQFIYVFPLIIILSVMRKLDLMQGVTIGALVTILINVGICFLPALLSR